MIHDAQVEVTCDGEECTEHIYIELPFVYTSPFGGGGHYDSDDSMIEDRLERECWTVQDGKHYCEGCSED